VLKRWRERRLKKQLAARIKALNPPTSPDDITKQLRLLLTILSDIQGIQFKKYTPIEAEKINLTVAYDNAGELFSALRDYTEQFMLPTTVSKHPARCNHRVGITMSLDVFLQDNWGQAITPEGAYHEIKQLSEQLDPHLDNQYVTRMGYYPTRDLVVLMQALLRFL